jgi:hypothetical protein
LKGVRAVAVLGRMTWTTALARIFVCKASFWIGEPEFAQAEQASPLEEALWPADGIAALRFSTSRTSYLPYDTALESRHKARGILYIPLLYKLAAW